MARQSIVALESYDIYHRPPSSREIICYDYTFVILKNLSFFIIFFLPHPFYYCLGIARDIMRAIISIIYALT